MVIWKYPVPIPDSPERGVEIAMPDSALPISVGVQNGQIVLWVEVYGHTDDQPNVARTFVVLPTGAPIKCKNEGDGGDYLVPVGNCTVQLPDGNVYHIYEVN